ncbi:MAG: hypothetical protein HY801_07190 [Candidatus Lindowbacteria bacterium]|nr:hypothetical protein [Candidatus Lindowbacteria bacterium]
MLSTLTQTEIYTEVLSESAEEQKFLKRCRPGERLTLCRLPDDPDNPTAIGVKRFSGETLGRLEKDVAERISPRMGEGELETVVLLITGGGFFSKQHIHCYVKIIA